MYLEEEKMREEEKEFLKMVSALLEGSASELRKIGLTADAPTVEVRQSSPHDYSSEISVYLRKDGQICDALEFHIFRSGRQVLSIDVARSWFANELEKLFELK